MIYLVKQLLIFVDHFLALSIITYIFLTAWNIALYIRGIDNNLVISYSIRAIGLLIIVVSTYSLLVGFIDLLNKKPKGKRMVINGTIGIVVIFTISILASLIAASFGPAINTRGIPHF